MPRVVLLPYHRRLHRLCLTKVDGQRVALVDDPRNPLRGLAQCRLAHRGIFRHIGIETLVQLPGPAQGRAIAHLDIVAPPKQPLEQGYSHALLAF